MRGPAVEAIPPLLFGLRARVDRRSYAVAALGLALVKYALEASLVRHETGSWMTPLQFLSPVLSLRYPAELSDGAWLLLALLHLPLVWVGASMSVRRARDAGLSPLVGLLFFVPIGNLFAFLTLCCLPSAPARESSQSAAREGVPVGREAYERTSEELRSGFLAVAATVPVTAVALVLASLTMYGAMLFVGAPFVLGFFVGWFHNRRHRRSFSSNFCASFASLLLCAGAFLLFAAEGVVCLVMVAPIAFPAVLMGTVLGAVATAVRDDGPLPLSTLALLPSLGLLEAPAARALSASVTTAVEVDAPPERVWGHVIAFPELPEERSWLFHTGIAWPTGATIEGEGAGAVRHCRFSTGTFVEPITVWDPPRRLAFDVAEQPDPMRELSPWGAIHPPHLETGFRSERGEFRLIPLPGGRTRIEGTTWYRIDLHPTWYWRLVAEPIVHRIHARVLEHVRCLAEG